MFITKHAPVLLCLWEHVCEYVTVCWLIFTAITNTFFANLQNCIIIFERVGYLKIKTKPFEFCIHKTTKCVPCVSDLWYI